MNELHAEPAELSGNQSKRLRREHASLLNNFITCTNKLSRGSDSLEVTSCLTPSDSCESSFLFTPFRCSESELLITGGVKTLSCLFNSGYSNRGSAKDRFHARISWCHNQTIESSDQPGDSRRWVCTNSPPSVFHFKIQATGQQTELQPAPSLNSHHIHWCT
jgi:hypothetical protein